MKILCSRCNQPFDGPICPRCGQAVATSGAGYTNMAPPPSPQKAGLGGADHYGAVRFVNGGLQPIGAAVLGRRPDAEICAGTRFSP